MQTWGEVGWHGVAAVVLAMRVRVLAVLAFAAGPQLKLARKRTRGNETAEGLPAWLRFPSLSLILAYAFVGALLGSISQVAGQGLQTYSNKDAGYTVTYPPNWHPSPQSYANAVEIRNYDNAHSVSEKDQASIAISQEATVSAEQAERRIQDLISAASQRGSFQLEKLPIGRHLLYQWTALEPPALPAAHPTKEKPVPSARMRRRVASAVIVTAYIIRMEGTAWEDADPQVIAEMTAITRNVKITGKKGGGK